MSRKGTRQLRVSMERIKAAANSRLMRLAQRMIVGGALLLDRVARRLELLVAQERSTQWLSYCQACRLFRRITATLVSVGSRRKSTESATSSPGSGSRRASALGNVDSSNPCWLYLDLSRAVHQKDVGSRLIRDLKAQMLRSIGSSSLPAADAHNLKAHVTTVALAEFRGGVAPRFEQNLHKSRQAS